MTDKRAGQCIGGPHDGEFRSYNADDMPVLAPGLDTEGDLLGHYLFRAGAWQWESDPLPNDAERTR